MQLNKCCLLLRLSNLSLRLLPMLLWLHSYLCLRNEVRNSLAIVRREWTDCSFCLLSSVIVKGSTECTKYSHRFQDQKRPLRLFNLTSCSTQAIRLPWNDCCFSGSMSFQNASKNLDLYISRDVVAELNSPLTPPHTHTPPKVNPNSYQLKHKKIGGRRYGRQ